MSNSIPSLIARAEQWLNEPNQWDAITFELVRHLLAVLQEQEQIRCNICDQPIMHEFLCEDCLPIRGFRLQGQAWQAIETCPERVTVLLAYGSSVVAGYKHTEPWLPDPWHALGDADAFTFSRPTHWMPLPAPPGVERTPEASHSRADRIAALEARLQEQDQTIARLLHHFEELGALYPHDETLYALVKALATPRPVLPQPPTK